MKKFLSIVFSLAMIFAMSVTVFATETITLGEAKEYLETYSITKENAVGKGYTTQYIFNSEQDLNNAATYIVEHGFDAFSEDVNEAIKEVVSKESKSTLHIPRTTDPSTAYAKISGNGTHLVSGETSGLASFDTLGTIEYLVELGYQVTVINNNMTNLTSISFDIPYISAAGSWGQTAFPSHCTTTNCGVTANFVITKTITIGLGDFSFDIKSETDNEIFTLLTSFN